MLAVAALLAGAAALPAPAGASADRRVVIPAYDFRVPGVRIFKWPTPAGPIMGLGYPGQGFDYQHTVSGAGYTCDNGGHTTRWEYGRNIATGVWGYVPTCNAVS